MHSELDQALALLIKAVACYIFVLTFQELLRILEPFLDLRGLQQWNQRKREGFGRPTQPSSAS
ncbi:hypothetical protein ASPFODRAFT_48443 [Aspergillus luchuensis CBS 106.47]|uniref:Uncharacterized protein n=1 Tax=Aspergillus luchuensis (strain CBS 106.47) TaxID=1137211 RepID=A0A1M3TCL8_ASPLC|nr:hypothetical protein ASPFODRAFT_48443 [Aspergillus luchuensis CBS 106.47]